MVKSDKQLQIRLTEPVLFLKGPSTGLDFRGRPQVISADAQPAQLRGLLTLRLSKPTRIRKIEIKLEGRVRTEWPEGIGPRHMETHEEKKILDEQSTYFTAIDGSESRSRSTRRPASVGPGGIDVTQYDVDPDAVDADGDDELWNQDDEVERGRSSRVMKRSASALPGTHDGHSWHRDGFSRRPSLDTDEEGGNELKARMSKMDVGPNEPSPAYTPLPEPQNSRRNSLGYSNRSPRNANSPLPSSREPDLTPIQSAATSRAPSNRDGSSSTERRENLAHHPHSALTTVANEDEEPSDDETALGDASTWTPEQRPYTAPAGSILHRHRHHDHSHPRGSVCFVDGLVYGANENPSPGTSTPGLVHPSSNRAASVRTMNSEHTGSTTSLPHDHPLSESSHSSQPPADPVRTISVVSTAHTTPAASTAASIRTRPSTDTLPRDGTAGSDTPLDRVTSGNAPVVSSPLSERPMFFGDVPAPNAGSSTSGGGASSSQSPVNGDSRRRSSAASILNNPNGSHDQLPHRPPLPGNARLASDQSGRSVSFSVEQQGSPSRQPSDVRPDHSPEDSRGRRSSKFSLSAALGAVKDRVSSKSRSRTASRVASRAGSVASLHDDLAGTSSQANSNQIQSQLPSDLTAAVHAKHGASASHSRDRRARGRTDSPMRVHGDKPRGKQGHDDRSPSRGRGRHKGMKVLTDALGLGDHPPEGADDVHNWKEFRKGTYNYPISFGIPPEAPPTLHAEFGSVTYRLKATVVRVGALTPNLTEDLEVTMIAQPQEDDMEETENIIVERQWEEQMRYQIALGGKAFPIGGIVPVSIRLMPLMKCKIHRLSVILEEKIDYFAHGKRITRHETPKKFILMFIKQLDKYGGLLPLLPILSEDSSAAKESPLAPLAAQAALSNPPVDQVEPDSEDWQFAQMMDPLGPWHFEKNLQIPDCASMLKVTSKHDKTSIQISHFLKVTIRVERGDDEAVDAKGRRKQFDIIIDTPIKILDCRVNPSWNSLPTYAANHPSAIPPPGFCSIHGQGRHNHANPVLSSYRPAFTAPNGPDQTIAAASSLPMSRAGSHDIEPSHQSAQQSHHGHRSKGKHKDRTHDDSLLERNIVYDRLMSGQETESGEVPPTYGEAVANAIRAASRSTSRHRLGSGSLGPSRVVSAAASGMPSVAASRRESVEIGRSS